MRKGIAFWMVLVLVAAGAAFATNLLTHSVVTVPITKEPAKAVQVTPEPPVESTYNDGWVDIFPVKMQGTLDDGIRHFDTYDDTITFDDFEGTQPPWTSADLDAGIFWHLHDTLAMGALSWWCGDECLAVEGQTAGAYNDHWLQYLISDTFSLYHAHAPELYFKAHWKIENPGGEPPGYDMWDAWNVWASSDLGASWTVLFPLYPAYTGTSSYAFGEEWGMGYNIPGYGGTGHTDVFEEIKFDLAAYIDEPSMLLRWAFCSDPAFSGADNPSYYGLIIDSIRVMDDDIRIHYNDGELDDYIATTVAEAADVWVYDNSTSHSPTHCWTAVQDTNATRGVYSYPITLPTGYYNLSIRYWVWCDHPDTDSDGDGYLDDYYQIMISDASCMAWEQIVYDYGYDNFEDPPGGNSAAGWVKREHGLISGGIQVDTIGISAWAGQTVRIAFRVTTDDTLLTGTGLHVDDVEVIATQKYAQDMETRDLIVPFPTTVNLPTSFQYTLNNTGLDSAGPPIDSDWWIFLNGTQQATDSVDFPALKLAPDEYTVATVNWTPVAVGSHRLHAASDLGGDQDHDNDTTYSPINDPSDPNLNLAVSVQPAGFYELAYHTRKLANAFSNPRYVRYTPEADGVPTADANDYNILQVKMMWRFEEDVIDTGATVWIEFWADSVGDPHHPSTQLLHRIETKIDTNETIGSASEPNWWTYTIEGVPALQHMAGNFWLSVWPQDTIDANSVPSLMGESVMPDDSASAADGHNYVMRLDSLPDQPIMWSPGRYLIQMLISQFHEVADLTVYRDEGTNDVTLRWGTALLATGYSVWRLTTPMQDYTTGTLLTPTPIPETTYTDTGILLAGVKYFYMVVATNE